MSIGVAVSGSRVEAEDLVQSALTNTYPKWRRIRPEDALAYLRRSVLKCPHQPVAAASRRRAHGRRAARADGIRRRDERSGRAARAAARPAPRAGPAAQRAGAALPVRPARRRVRRARAGRRRPGLPAAEQVLAPGRHGEPDAASSTAPPPDSSHRPDDFSVEDPGTASFPTASPPRTVDRTPPMPPPRRSETPTTVPSLPPRARPSRSYAPPAPLSTSAVQPPQGESSSTPSPPRRTH
jgi:hypothetical protein